VALGKDNVEIDDSLMVPIGGLPAKNAEVFKKVVGSLIEAWGIVRPQEVMMVNRMVSTWMKMKRVEELMGKYDLFFEQRDKGGALVGVKLNELANYLSRLDADFRGYYRALQVKSRLETGKDGDLGDLIDLMNAKSVSPAKKKPKKKKSEKK